MSYAEPWPIKDTTVYVTLEGQKFRGQLFIKTQQSKRGQRTMMCYFDLCTVFKLFFFLKYNVNSLPGQN